MLDEYWRRRGEGVRRGRPRPSTAPSSTSVGIRLKGNSTLSGADPQRRDRRVGRGGPGGGRRPPAGRRMPRRVPAARRRRQPGGGQAAASGRRPGGFGRTLEGREPENLPWLISFDEFVEGRRYQGHREIAVRVAGMGGGTHRPQRGAVAEPCSPPPGETTQRYAYAGVHRQRPAHHGPAARRAPRRGLRRHARRRRRALQVAGHRPVHRPGRRPDRATRTTSSRSTRRAARTCSRSST